MAVTLRGIYQDLSGSSTAKHAEFCKELLRTLRAPGDDNLAQLFADAVASNTNFNQLKRPFIDDDLRRRRKPLSAKSTGTNRVAYVMKEQGLFSLTCPDVHTFRFLEREIPHLRGETLEQQDKKGWIDYVGVTDRTPVLGEIKYESDQNPFYAFIQLLTYLSEMVTENQIRRAVDHRLFGDDVREIAAFDLHIFLANFNDRGTKGELIEPTKLLAILFKRRLGNIDTDLARKLRNVICISAKIKPEQSRFDSLDGLWAA